MRFPCTTTIWKFISYFTEDIVCFDQKKTIPLMLYLEIIFVGITWNKQIASGKNRIFSVNTVSTYSYHWVSKLYTLSNKNPST